MARMVTTEKTPAEPGTTMDYALHYAAIGWPVFPVHGIKDGACTCGDTACKSPGKHPIKEAAPNGVKNATTDEALIQIWCRQHPYANLALATGGELFALDVDTGEKGGEDTLDKLERENGALPDSVRARTGSGGWHYLFTTGDTVASGTNKLGPGLDIRGEGGYIVVEPSVHVSGVAYVWEEGCDPIQNGVAPAPAPKWLLELAETASTKPAPAPSPAETPLSSELVRDLRSALAFIPADDRDTWYKVGMALHSTGGQQAYGIWTEWSQQSEKFDPADQARVWASFKPGGGLNYESIFAWAEQYGWVNPLSKDGRQPEPQPADAVQVKSQPAETSKAPPNETLRPPGALGHFTDWINRTAYKRQPALAVQAALALGSVALGRRYCTDKYLNYSSLYFLNVAQSGAGKEHPKKCIEDAMAVAGLDRMLGGDGYTSAGAVYSLLRDKPTHLALMDEFADTLETSAVKQNYQQRQVISLLMQAWGRLNGMLTPTAYSTMTLSAQQKDGLDSENIHHPAISLMAMTTPRKFYEQLDSGSVDGGFLGRFLIVESDIGRQATGDASHAPVPPSVVEWLQNTRSSAGNLDESVAEDPERPPEATKVPMVEHTIQLHSEFESEMLGYMDWLEQYGYEALLTRTHEIALRLALILAVSERPSEPRVQDHHMEWAIQYARHHALQTAEAMVARAADSPFEALTKEVYQVIVGGGERGKTKRELQRSRLQKHKPKEINEALDALQQAGYIASVDLGPPQNGGHNRVAWVAVEDDA